jgi:hypothetical protein
MELARDVIQLQRCMKHPAYPQKGFILLGQVSRMF